MYDKRGHRIYILSLSCENRHGELLVGALESASLDGDQNLLVNGNPRFQLSWSETALALRVLREIVLPCVEDTTFVEKHDRIGVQAFMDISSDALYGGKHQIRA